MSLVKTGQIKILVWNRVLSKSFKYKLCIVFLRILCNIGVVLILYMLYYSRMVCHIGILYGLITREKLDSWNVLIFVVTACQLIWRIVCLKVNTDSDILQFYTYDFWESQINNCNGYSQYQKYSHCHHILQRNNTPLGTVMKFYLNNEYLL